MFNEALHVAFQCAARFLHRRPQLSSVLRLADLFHPVDTLPCSAPAMAMCVIAIVGAAPCQCLSPGENHTPSPGRISSMGPAGANPRRRSRWSWTRCGIGASEIPETTTGS